MVNRSYAGSPADFAIKLGAKAFILDDDGETPTTSEGWAVLIPDVASEFDVYDGEGTQYTDLVDSEENSVSVITASADFLTAGQILLFTVNDAPNGDIYLVGTGGTPFDDPTFRLSPVSDEIFERLVTLEARGLVDLPDVDTTDIADGKFLAYDADTAKHVYANPVGTGTVTSVNGKTPTAGAVTLTAADLLAATSADMDVLKSRAYVFLAYNGSGYEAKPAGFTRSIRIGPAEPTTNLVDGDIWLKPETT